MGSVPLYAWVFALGLVGSGVAALVGLWALRRLVKRPAVEPKHPDGWPAISILKPLAGLDDDLLDNLNSHLALDYPGEFEVLLGVEDEHDLAYPVAKAFAEANPHRVRLVLQEGRPGLNPKVNQIITLNRHARHAVLAVTDSNIRVPPQLLRQHAAQLQRPDCGLSSCLFVGAGEETLGAALDNMTHASFVAPNLALFEHLLAHTQMVGKSFAVKRAALEQVGGWETVKDLLAEDQQLGQRLHHAGFHTALTSTVVQNVQRRSPLRHFIDRNARWAMIRFRVVRPAVFFEPALNSTLWALGFFFAAGPAIGGPVLLLTLAYVAMVAQLGARFAGRGGFAPHWLALVGLRDLLLLGCWVYGGLLKSVVWRGNLLKVGRQTRLG